MKKLVWVFVWLAGATMCADVLALDAVRRSGAIAVNGKVVAMSPTEVTVEKSGGSEKVPVNTIVSIEFDGEPSAIKLARSAVRNGGYTTALQQLDKITPAELARAELKQDYEFYRALANARLAIGGAADIKAAGQAMYQFVSQYPNNYHFLEANEVLGDLLLADKQYDKYQQYYTALEQSPFPEYKMRAGVASGNALVNQAKYAEALAAFEKVLAVQGASGAATQSQKFAATLGKARCLAETGQPQPAIELINGVIANLGPEEADLMARAYVTLGNCYRKLPDGVKPALLAFLHVDVLFSGNPQAHAEALAHLAELWDKDGKPERGAQARQVLRSRYASSAWAQ